MTEHETAEILALLAAAFPHHEVRTETLGIYHEHLRDLPAASVQAAASDLIRSERWFPSVGTLRQRVAEAALIIPTAAEELDRITSECQVRYSPAVGDIPDWSSVNMPPVTAEAFRVAGERPADREGIEWWERRFIRAYNAARERAIQAHCRGEGQQAFEAGATKIEGPSVRSGPTTVQSALGEIMGPEDDA